MPEVYEIAGSGLEGAAHLLLKLCKQNEMEKHGKSNEIKCQIETEIRRKMWEIVEEIHRAWKVPPTPDEEEEGWPAIILIEEQDWFEIIRNQLTMYLKPLLLEQM